MRSALRKRERVALPGDGADKARRHPLWHWLNGVVRESPCDLLIRAEMKDLGRKTTAGPFVIKGDAADAREDRKQLEFQVGGEFKGLHPIRANCRFPFKGTGGFPSDLGDYRR